MRFHLNRFFSVKINKGQEIFDIGGNKFKQKIYT